MQKNRGRVHRELVIRFSASYPAMLEWCMIPSEIEVMAFGGFDVYQHNGCMAHPVIMILADTEPEHQRIVPGPWLFAIRLGPGQGNCKSVIFTGGVQ